MSSWRIVWPACFEAHVANVHQLATGPRRMAVASDSTWYACVILRLRMTGSAMAAMPSMSSGVSGLRVGGSWGMPSDRPTPGRPP